MLSVIDRKKKAKMSVKEAMDLDSTKGMDAQSRTNYVADLNLCVTETAPSGNLAPKHAPSAPIHSTHKLQPRGATERQSVSNLRAFLKSTNPGPSNNEHPTQLLKSAFDWDSSDDEDAVDDRRSSISQVRNSNLESLHRITRRWQEAMVGGSKAKATADLHGTGLLIDSWMANAQKYAEGRRGEVENSTGGMEHARSKKSGNAFAMAGRGGSGRRSVLKLFDDPVWSNEGELNPNSIAIHCQADL